MPSGGSTSTETTTNPLLQRLSLSLFNESDPLRRTILSQALEAAQTGGVTAQIPMIQTAVTNSLSGLNLGMKSAKEALGRLGLGSDPVSQGIFASILTQGLQQAGNIPTDLAGQLLGMGGGAALSNLPGAAIGGLRGLGTTAGSTSTTPSGLDIFTSIAGALGNLAAGAGALWY